MMMSQSSTLFRPIQVCDFTMIHSYDRAIVTLIEAVVVEGVVEVVVCSIKQ